MAFVELVLICLLILLNGFFAASEFALISLRKSRVRHLYKSGHPVAGRVLKLQERPERFLATVQIGVTLVGTLASALGGVIAVEVIRPALADAPIELVRRWAEPIALGLVVSVITYVTLVAGELVPKTIAIRYAEPITFLTAPLIDGLSRLFRWLLTVLETSTMAVLRVFGIKEHQDVPLISEDEVKYLIREGRKTGVFEPSEEDLIHSVFKFTDTVVREIMVPRTEIVAVETGSSIEEILDLMNERGFSRLPVYAGTVDNVTGVVYLKDLLSLHISNRPFSLEQVIRKPYVVPPTKKVSILLKEMRERRMHLVFVGDEYGGIDGLVTMEDLIEEIVGDIRDEQEKVLSEIEEIAANRYVVEGRTDIGRFNEVLGAALPEDEFETVGGYVLGLFGRLPAEGDQVRSGDLLFTVLRLRKNRIARIRVLKYENERLEGDDHDNETGP